MLDQENEEKIYMVHYHILTEELTILYIDTYLRNAHLILGNEKMNAHRTINIINKTNQAKSKK